MATAAPPLRIGLADDGRRMTLDAFEGADFEEGYRYELARGVLEVTQVPGERHGSIVDVFACAVVDHRRLHPDRVFRSGGGAEFRLRLPGTISGRNPDYAVVLRGTPKNPRGQRPPALAVEVVSAGTEARHRDYATKREEYLAYGLLEYWIIDPEMRRVTIVVRDGNVWTKTIFGDGQSASGLVLPGFALPVAALWAIRDDEEPSA